MQRLFQLLAAGLPFVLAAVSEWTPGADMASAAAGGGGGGGGAKDKAPTWQYRADDLRFVDFSRGDSAQIEKGFTTTSDARYMATLGKNKYSVDFDRMTQMNVATKKVRLLRRVAPDGRTMCRAPRWEWQTHHKGKSFTAYDAPTSELLERAYAKKELHLRVKVATGPHDDGTEVDVHFVHMRQTNPDTGATRDVRRIEHPEATWTRPKPGHPPRDMWPRHTDDDEGGGGGGPVKREREATDAAAGGGRGRRGPRPEAKEK